MTDWEQRWVQQSNIEALLDYFSCKYFFSSTFLKYFSGITHQVLPPTSGVTDWEQRWLRASTHSRVTLSQEWELPSVKSESYPQSRRRHRHIALTLGRYNVVPHHGVHTSHVLVFRWAFFTSSFCHNCYWFNGSKLLSQGADTDFDFGPVYYNVAYLYDCLLYTSDAADE